MANKRDEPKPGSVTGVGEFMQSLYDVGAAEPSWWIRNDEICDAPHTKMAQRCAELLAHLQLKGPSGEWETYLKPDPAVMKRLVKNGDVVRKTPFPHNSHEIRQNHVTIAATWFPKKAKEGTGGPNAKKKAALKEADTTVEKVETRTIKWNKRKNDQLLFDTIMGTADPDVIRAVGRTKTKMRKLKILPPEDTEEKG